MLTIEVRRGDELYSLVDVKVALQISKTQLTKLVKRLTHSVHLSSVRGRLDGFMVAVISKFIRRGAVLRYGIGALLEVPNIYSLADVHIEPTLIFSLAPPNGQSKQI